MNSEKTRKPPLSRRDFLRISAGLAGGWALTKAAKRLGVGGDPREIIKKVPPVPSESSTASVTLPVLKKEGPEQEEPKKEKPPEEKPKEEATEEETKEEKEIILDWEGEKREKINQILGKNTDTEGVYWQKVIDQEAFEKNGLSWQELEEDTDRLAALNSELQAHGVPLRLKCSWRALLNLAVARHEQIVANPYVSLIDPDVKEVEEIMNKVAQLTGLPAEMIKTFAWRENGMKGEFPDLHGDTYVPSIGRGIINFEVAERYYGKEVCLVDTKRHDGNHTVIKAPGREDGYVLPIEETTVSADALLGTLIPMAICLEHVEKALIGHQNPPQIAPLVNFCLNFKTSNSEPDKMANFVGLAYMFYHHGLYRPEKGIRGEPLDFTRIANERFTKFDPHQSSTKIRERIPSFFQAQTTFDKHRPWEKERYRLDGKGSAEKYEFYCQMPSFIRKHVDENPHLFSLLSGPIGFELANKHVPPLDDDKFVDLIAFFGDNQPLLQEIMKFNMIDFFRKNFKLLCDREVYTAGLEKAINGLIIDSGFDYKAIQKTTNPVIRKQLEKLTQLLEAGKDFARQFSQGYEVGQIDPSLSKCLYPLAYYYLTWSDRSWPGEDLCQITRLHSSEIDLTPEDLVIPEEEKQALLALYHSTNGQDWKVKWDLSIPPDLWHGVVIENNHVVKIKLTDNNLCGPLTSELENLEELAHLDLDFNRLSGPIPPEWGNLSELVQLWLDKNQLTGPIPPELGRLTKLQTFSAENNQLTGPIPPELGNWKELLSLWLSGNQLSGSIPSELGGLTKLGMAGFGNNQFSGEIPLIFGQLINLRLLLVGGNKLVNLPEKIGLLKREGWEGSGVYSKSE